MRKGIKQVSMGLKKQNTSELLMASLTMKQIAQMAGVSQTAVSAVLNNKHGTIRLSQSTRQKIEAVLEKTHFRPNTVGKALSLGRSLMIGMVVNDVASSFVPQVIQAVEDYTHQKGYGLLLMTSRNDLDRQDKILDFMLERGVEGILVDPARGVDEGVTKKLSAKRIPCVSLFAQPPQKIEREGYVCVDHGQVGYLGIKHLVERGHRRILAVNQCEWTKSGMKKAIAESGIKIDLKCKERWNDNCEHEVVNDWRKSKNPASAMFVRGDERACRIMNLLVRQGVRIPQDLAMVGVDDIATAKNAVVPLTSVSQPKNEQGIKAACMLFDMIDGGRGEKCIFAPELVVREST